MIIDFLTTGDFSLILTRVYVILAMWAIMCIAVCVDLWAGVNSARPGARRFIPGDSGEHSLNWETTGVYR